MEEILTDSSANDAIGQAGTSIIELSVDIVSAYVGSNSVPRSELAMLIGSIHSALNRLGPQAQPTTVAEPLKPAVSARRSVHAGHIVCLEDGERYKSLKRHLTAAHGMTAEEYREKWNLPGDYPMVAPDYAKARSKLAKEMGLGKKLKKKK